MSPEGFEIVRGGRRYRVGNKIMQIRNNYEKNVFNGGIRFISDIDSENQQILVNIDGNDISYEYSELDDLVLAYAVSIHRSQGSEYPVIVMPLVMSHYMMVQRNLVYQTNGLRVNNFSKRKIRQIVSNFFPNSAFS